MRVLRVYHGGRDEVQRARERALIALGADVTLVVPASWPGAGEGDGRRLPELRVVELEIERAGDVNRHRYRRSAEVARLVADVEPDVLDVHEEPFSTAASQWLRAAPADLPIAMYTAQNIDKRFPPPFSWHERRALRRVGGLYPCSRQAASVARAKGYAGLTRVIPLGFDPQVFVPGSQSHDDPELVLGVFGRLVPEKGVRAAVHVLARVQRERPARLILVGRGPEAEAALALADRLGIGGTVEVCSPNTPHGVASLYRTVHIVLVPSLSTPRWVEQFGRVIVEAQASGAVVAGYASGAIPEVAGSAAALAPEGRLDLLGDKVASLVQDGSEWLQRRDGGLQLATERTWDHIAAMHLDLYRDILAVPSSVAMPRSPAERRRAARREFGPSAATPAGTRPFAFPPLRAGSAISSLLGAALDQVEEVAARLPRKRLRRGTSEG